MKKFLFVFLVLVVAVTLSACGKKEESLEQMQEPLSMEALSKLNTEAAPVAVEPKAGEMPAVAQSQATMAPVGTPTSQDIQTALKNAGYYSGAIDGKLGPMSKKAVGEFQKANGLQADGKVGSKTWAALSAYLNSPASTPVPEKKKKR